MPFDSDEYWRATRDAIFRNPTVETKNGRHFFHYWRLYLPTGEEFEDTVECHNAEAFYAALEQWNRCPPGTGNFIFSDKPAVKNVIERLKG